MDGQNDMIEDDELELPSPAEEIHTAPENAIPDRSLMPTIPPDAATPRDTDIVPSRQAIDRLPDGSPEWSQILFRSQEEMRIAFTELGEEVRAYRHDARLERQASVTLATDVREYHAEAIREREASLELADTVRDLCVRVEDAKRSNDANWDMTRNLINRCATESEVQYAKTDERLERAEGRIRAVESALDSLENRVKKLEP